MLVFVAVAAMIGALHAVPARAGNTGGALVNCQVAHPSGAPISIAILKRDNLTFDTSGNVTFTEIQVAATFRGTTFGPFSVFNGSVSALNAIDAGCQIFNDMGLSSQILGAIGLPGTTLNFTACSFVGASDPSCNAPAGTINTPPGWVSNLITGYAGH